MALNNTYTEVLLEYCRTHAEESLYQASLISAGFIQDGMGPDEIVAIHFDSVQTIANQELIPYAERIRILNDAHQFLLEIMIGYGAQYKDYLDLRLDAAVRRAESAERSEQEKLEILAMIAHELANPLTVALGNMEVASRYLDAQDMKNMRPIVDDSRQALSRLALLTSQIVAASKNEPLTFDMEEICAKDVLSRLMILEQNAATEKQLELVVHEPTEDVKIRGNMTALVSVLDNLVSNAIRYTPEGGHIEVSVRRERRNVIICVCDSGIGISNEDKARIFEKFFRADKAKRSDSRGLGMGLAITAQLVAAHNGRIEVESEPDKGSTFTVVLPAI
ncbi:MAG TPA: ATP-binding protein [Dehalococcoidia bacterium]|nr:ATP-binding protein [Dehalococcoidia bacterium]